MSSNKVNIYPKEQQNANMLQDLSKLDINKTNNNFQNSQEQEQKKTKMSNKVPIIIIGAIIVVLAILVIILVICLRKPKSRSIKLPNPVELNETIPITIITDIITTDFPDSDDDKYINYTEAEKLIGLDSIKKNRIIFDETLNDINTLLLYNNTNLTNINATINSSPENLEFLIDANESSLEIAENDLDLYISKYSSLSEQANELSNDLSENINSIPLDEFKDENIKLTGKFEKNIQNLATVFMQNSTMLRNLNLDELKNQIEVLNNLYNNFLNETKIASENLISSIKLIVDKVNLLNIKINNGILEVNKIIGNITNKIKIHEKLIEIKNVSISLRQYIDDIKSEFNEKTLSLSAINKAMDNIKIYIKKENNIIENITNLISEKIKTYNVTIQN